MHRWIVHNVINIKDLENRVKFYFMATLTNANVTIPLISEQPVSKYEDLRWYWNIVVYSSVFFNLIENKNRYENEEGNACYRAKA